MRSRICHDMWVADLTGVRVDSVLVRVLAFEEGEFW